MVLGTFPKAFFPWRLPMWQLPNVEFSKRQLPKGQIRPSEALQAAVRAEHYGYDGLGGRTPRQEHAAPKTDFGSCRMANCTFEKLPLGKIPLGSCHLMEVPNMFLKFEVYLIFARLGISAEGLKVQSLISFIVSSCLYPGAP